MGISVLLCSTPVYANMSSSHSLTLVKKKKHATVTKQKLNLRNQSFRVLGYHLQLIFFPFNPFCENSLMQILICYCVCRFESRGFPFSIPSFYLFTKKEHVIFLEKKKELFQCQRFVR